MRGADTFTESLFTMRRLDNFVPKSHPLRPIRAMVNQALAKMDRLFGSVAPWQMSSTEGRPRGAYLNITPVERNFAGCSMIIFDVWGSPGQEPSKSFAPQSAVVE